MSSNFEKIKPASQLNHVASQLSLLFEEFEKTPRQKIQIDCPFCSHMASTKAFSYQSCIYRQCEQCRSLYVSPRITAHGLGEYYSFMKERFHYDIPQSQRQVRLDTIIKPRWELIADKLKSYGKQFPIKRYMEIGPGVGYFTEVALEKNCAEQYLLVEPDPHCHAYLMELKGKVTLFDCLLEDCNEDKCGNIDIIFINSVIEHPFSLNLFFDKLHKLLNKDGIIVLVDMHAEGFDIELLRENTPNVSPYSILQVGSIQGIETICHNHGLKVKETFSIGMMDIDILYEYSKHLAIGHPLKGFERLFLRKEVRSDLQAVLAKHLLTGYNGYLIQK